MLAAALRSLATSSCCAIPAGTTACFTITIFFLFSTLNGQQEQNRDTGKQIFHRPPSCYYVCIVPNNGLKHSITALLSVGTGLQALGRSLLERELPNGTFTVFSALHDPLSGTCLTWLRTPVCCQHCRKHETGALLTLYVEATQVVTREPVIEKRGGMCCARPGEARVYAEVHPDTVCFSVAACQFSVKGGNRETVRVQARPEVPFGTLSEKPQLRECFIFCTLPAPGSELEEVTIEGRDGQTLATWPVEVCNTTRSCCTVVVCRCLIVSCST